MHILKVSYTFIAFDCCLFALITLGMCVYIHRARVLASNCAGIVLSMTTVRKNVPHNVIIASSCFPNMTFMNITSKNPSTEKNYMRCTSQEVYD